MRPFYSAQEAAAYEAGYQHGYYAWTHYIDTSKMACREAYEQGFLDGRKGGR